MLDLCACLISSLFLTLVKYVSSPEEISGEVPSLELICSWTVKNSSTRKGEPPLVEIHGEEICDGMDGLKWRTKGILGVRCVGPGRGTAFFKPKPALF